MHENGKDTDGNQVLSNPPEVSKGGNENLEQTRTSAEYDHVHENGTDADGSQGLNSPSEVSKEEHEELEQTGTSAERDHVHEDVTDADGSQGLSNLPEVSNGENEDLEQNWTSAECDLVHENGTDTDGSQGLSNDPFEVSKKEHEDLEQIGTSAECDLVGENGTDTDGSQGFCSPSEVSKGEKRDLEKTGTSAECDLVHENGTDTGGSQGFCSPSEVSKGGNKNLEQTGTSAECDLVHENGTDTGGSQGFCSPSEVSKGGNKNLEQTGTSAECDLVHENGTDTGGSQGFCSPSEVSKGENKDLEQTGTSAECDLVHENGTDADGSQGLSHHSEVSKGKHDDLEQTGTSVECYLGGEKGTDADGSQGLSSPSVVSMGESDQLTDDDYVPESEDVSTDSEDEEFIPHKSWRKYVDQTSPNHSNNASEEESEQLEQAGTSAECHMCHQPLGKLAQGSPNPSKSECEQQASKTDKGTKKITVMRTHNTKGKRLWDKGSYCPFCRKYVKKLPRHLAEFKGHKDELDVVRWKATTDKVLKDQLLTKMRNLGNYLHNHAVLQEGEGEIITVYRPNYDANYKKYVPCHQCKGYFSKRELWKHSCKLVPDENEKHETSQKKRKPSCIKKGRLLQPAPGMSTKVREIYAGLREDENGVSFFIKGDQLTRLLAEKLAFKLGHDEDQFDYIRTKLRETGRLVLEYRKVTADKNAGLADLIHPSKFTDIVQATRNISGFDEKSHTYTTPSLALKLGHTLKKAAGVLLGQAIMKENEAMERRCNQFIRLCELKWTESVSSHALRTLNENKRNNPTYLPVTKDVVKLTSYLKTETEEVITKLNEETTDEDISKEYRYLAELTLTSIIVFNRKRSGEVSKMKLDDFSKCKQGDEVTDDYGLSKWEAKLGKNLWRLEIVGKKQRAVPVLLTSEMKRSMDLLVAKRGDAGVYETNPYVFALTSSNGHIRGSDVVRKFSISCGASKPSYITSTRLRKHIATVSQVMNLRDNELDVLANFMGHDVRIHRNFYRLPDHVMQVAKVSKILMCMDKGSLGKLHGSTLDEVQLDEGEEVPLDDALDPDVDHDADEEDIVMDAEVSTDASQLQHSDVGQFDKENAVRRVKAVIKSGSKVKGTKRERGQKRKRPWTKEEKLAVAKRLKTCFETTSLPGKAQCEECLKCEKSLRGRDWHNIKDFVRNQIRKADPLDFLDRI
ncbi:uncharacterized protein [Diadema setosum]|uniref:uncharacterized protein n=1 Tax=Diadema setosum TaxID=31175 RepID=UPI003B3AF77B